MNPTRENRAKEIQDAIREVLYREWDPIGVCGSGPKNEYDAYIGGIYRVLVSKPAREVVAGELKKIERENMGFDQVEEEALLGVADRLLAIDLQLTP